MRNVLSKRIIAVALSLILCVSAAVMSSAVEGSAVQNRTITLNSDKVIQSDYKGIGDNLWVGPYAYGMNDAYQKVNEARTNKIQPAWMRMLFEPCWMVFLDEDVTVQQERWEAGIYNTDSVEYKDFMNKVKMFAQAGTVVQLNMGGRVDVAHKMADWFSIKDSAISEGGSRGAPANLEAFAKATAKVVSDIKDITEQYGVEGLNKNNGKPIVYLSFYNETNGLNFEAFGNKTQYYVKMVKLVHYELIDANLRDYVQICGTDLSGFSNESAIIKILKYTLDNLRDENGEPIFDYLANHHYHRTRSIKEVQELSADYFNILELTPDELDLRITESSAGTRTTTETTTHIFNFGHNDMAQGIINMGSGISGYGSWFFHGEYITNPINVGQSDLEICMWTAPSQGLDKVSYNFAGKSLLMRYTYKHGVSYEAKVSHDDIIASYITSKDGSEHAVFIDSDKCNSDRTITIEVDNNIPDGTVFERHTIDYSELVLDENGWEIRKAFDHQFEMVDSAGNTQGGENAIIPPTDKYVTVENGKIVDNLSNNHTSVVYTTTKEVVQVELEDAELYVTPENTVSFDVKKVYGADNQNVRFEVMGKNDYQSAGNGIVTKAEHNYGGYGWTTENAGTITADGVYTATGTNLGDTIAIKVIPEADPDAYSVAIVCIGYTISFNTNGGSAVDNMVYKVSDYTGGFVYNSELPVPTRDGFKFEGWYDNESLTGSAYETASYKWKNDITLYAKWKAE